MPERAESHTDQSNEAEKWTVYGIPTFITKQVPPGTIIAFSMIYEPTEARDDRWRISAVKVTGLASDDQRLVREEDR
jgi:hypothetical protein